MAQSVEAGLLQKGDTLLVFSHKRMAPTRLKIRNVLPHGETVLVQFMGSEPSITLLKSQKVGAEIGGK